MAKIITPLAMNVPIVDDKGNPTPYFNRILGEISDAKISASVIDAMGGDPGGDRVVVWDDAAGDLAFMTTSEALDFITGASHGDILYRDSAGWETLGPGTAGQLLQTNGAGADPTWETPATPTGTAWTSVASGTFSGSVVPVTGLGTYNELLIMFKAATTSSSGIRIVTVSTNNGSSYFTSSGNYIHIPSSGTESNRSNVEVHDTATTAARSAYCHILNTAGTYKHIYTPTTDHWFVGDTSNRINAIRMASTAGNLNGGTYVVFGR